jgi:hypothetical protein
MKPEEILNAMEHIDADLIEAADGPVKKRNSMVSSVAALAAMLVLVISIAFALGDYSGGPVQMGSRPGTSHLEHSSNCSCRPRPSTVSTSPYFSGPSNASPSNFRFERLSQLKQMLAIAKEQPDELINYVHSENIGYWDGYYPTQSDVALLEAWLQSTAVPCRNDHSSTLSSIYYHPKKFYDNDIWEFFYNIDGIRYCFLVSDSPAWNPDGEEVTIVQIGSFSAEMRVGSYGSSRRLMAHFYVNDVVISMWVNTTDPSKVDLSGFFLSNIFAIE